jgi:SAM-dependent methyltransferase
LDIGSGPGDFAREFLESFPGAEVLGLEYSRTGVEIARSEVPAGRFLQRDLLQPQEPEAADRAWANLAVCSEVLEHVDEPARLLGNARPYLADGARVLITVPGGPMSYFDRHIGHRRHFSRAALAEIIVRAGYRVRGVWGAGFPFFNLYKLAVIARGQGLVKDASPTERGGMGWPVQVAMKAFNVLFKLNLGFTPLGWQIVAVAEASERRDGM